MRYVAKVLTNFSFQRGFYCAILKFAAFFKCHVTKSLDENSVLEFVMNKVYVIFKNCAWVRLIISDQTKANNKQLELNPTLLKPIKPNSKQSRSTQPNPSLDQPNPTESNQTKRNVTQIQPNPTPQKSN